MAVKKCENCEIFSWTQLEERGVEEMKKCGKCKFVNYCSKECQYEHWVKVGDGYSIQDLVLF